MCCRVYPTTPEAYELQEVIGRGGAAQVSDCRWPHRLRAPSSVQRLRASGERVAHPHAPAPATFILLGMQVHRAFCRMLHEEVAIKVLALEDVASNALGERRQFVLLDERSQRTSL